VGSGRLDLGETTREGLVTRARFCGRAQYCVYRNALTAFLSRLQNASTAFLRGTAPPALLYAAAAERPVIETVVLDLVLEGEAAAAAASGMDFRAFPIPDRGVPASRESLAELADDIIDALEMGKNVAVHCRQGIGRSGMIVGGVLVAAGTDVVTALRTTKESRGLDVPETEEQQDWLREFSSWLATRQAAAAADERRAGRRSNSPRS
jgi:protein-tyrosine phosphatase